MAIIIRKYINYCIFDQNLQDYKLIEKFFSKNFIKNLNFK